MKRISINTLKVLLMLFIAGTLFSCEKKTKEPPSTRKTIVKILGGGTPVGISKKPVDFVPVPAKLLAVDLRREPNDESGLFSTMNVVVTDDPAAVTAANPNYIILPDAWYTIQSEAPKVGGPGGTFSFVFKPGEFVKEIYITLTDPTLLNPSALYGLGFTITSVDASGQISNAKSIVVEIGAKNDYDGRYEISGTFLDVTNAAFVGDYPWNYSLVTISATHCVVINDDFPGIPAYIFYTGTGYSFYGGYGLIVGFDPATGAISDLHNYYGDPTQPATAGGNPAAGTGPPLYAASNTRRATLDPSGVNAFNLGTHNIEIKHYLLHPAVMGNNDPRCFFNEVWTYVGPR